jgi:glutamine amidotransferase
MTARIVLVDYGAGNIRSVNKALSLAADRVFGADHEVLVSHEPVEIARADWLVVPGQGAFGACREGLLAHADAWGAITTHVDAGRPYLGICVGMQLMAARGLEFGEHLGFGWIDGEVSRIAPTDPNLKIPHMGWNMLTLDMPQHPVLAHTGSGTFVYFAHSFAMVLNNPAQRLAHARYGGAISAAVGRDNMVGFQFHPEKSQRAGLDLLCGFLEWRP